MRLSEQQTRSSAATRAAGAPLSGGDEFARPDLEKTDAAGAAAIPARSHVRLAHPDSNDGVQILRRGYNFVDGNNDLGRLDAGLFFLSYQRSPAQFVTLQRSLSTDAHERVHPARRLRHLGGPARCNAGSYVGAELFA